MKKQKLQNERLDEIGRNLLETARTRNDEIEKIVAAPHLFDSVKARIKAEEARSQTKSLFSRWFVFGNWNWQPATAMAAVSILFFAGILSVILYKNYNASENKAQVAETKNQAPIISNEAPSETLVSKDNSQKHSADLKENNAKNLAQRINLKTKATEPKKPAQKRIVSKPLSTSEPEIEGDFYQLTFAGNSEETSEDEQLIRVELPRASLVALGVNPPAESENGDTGEKVKTDLLIGSDGVVRAVRLIK